MTEKDDKIDFKLPLLTSDSYPRWKYDIQIVLEVRGVWRVAIGKEKPAAVPRKPTTAVDGDEKTQTRKDAELKYQQDVVAYKASLADWNTKDAKAREILTRSLDDRHHQMIRSCVTAHAILMAMQTLYEQKTSSNIFLATQQFHALKWTADTDAMTFVSKLKGLASNMESLGEAPTEATIISKVINELPKSFAILKETWEVTMIAGIDLKLNDLLSQLVKCEANRKAEGKDFSPNSAYSVTKESGFSGKCFNCGRKGHTKSKCYSPGGDAYDLNYNKNRSNGPASAGNPNEKTGVKRATAGY